MDADLRRRLVKARSFIFNYGTPEPARNTRTTEYVIRDFARLEKPFYAGTEMVNGMPKHMWVATSYFAEKFTDLEDINAVIAVRFDILYAASLVAYNVPVVRRLSHGT